LAIKGKVLGRKALAEICSIVTPETILFATPGQRSQNTESQRSEGIKGPTLRIAMTNRLHRIMNRRLAVFIAVCAFPIFASTLTRADDFLGKRQKELAKNPEGVVFKIGFNDHKNHFQQGEIIRIELSFSNKFQKKYQLDGATYDRSGRLGLDSYYVDPSNGAVDPLKDCFDYDPIRQGGAALNAHS
jgi:hypothetical protein